MPLIHTKDSKCQRDCLNGYGEFARWNGVPSVTVMERLEETTRNHWSLFASNSVKTQTQQTETRQSRQRGKSKEEAIKTEDGRVIMTHIEMWHKNTYKTKNNPYQKEFLSYVEGFYKRMINNDPTNIFPMTNGKRQDGIPLQADARQAKESNKGDTKEVEKEIQLHIEDNKDFIIEMITFFTPAREIGHKLEEHRVLDLQ